MPQLKAQPLFVSDEQIITEVASLGGYTMITKEGKWALAAQHLGLKSSKAVDVQRRYEHILNGIPKDEYDDDEAADDSEGALDDGSESSAGDHEIDRIVGEKNKKGFREFLVKWQGTDETTWEPGANLSKCQAAIAKWREKYPTPVDNGGDPVYAREPSSSGRKRDVTELNDVDASRPRKRPSSAKPDVVLCVRKRPRAAASRIAT